MRYYAQLSKKYSVSKSYVTIGQQEGVTELDLTKIYCIVSFLIGKYCAHLYIIHIS
jgi:hypothetical protein